MLNDVVNIVDAKPENDKVENSTLEKKLAMEGELMQGQLFCEAIDRFPGIILCNTKLELSSLKGTP